MHRSARVRRRSAGVVPIRPLTGEETRAGTPRQEGGGSMRRVVDRLVVLLLAVALLAVVGFGVGGWYYSDQLLLVPVPEPPAYDVPIVDVDLLDHGWAPEPAAAPTEVAGEPARFELATTEGALVELETVGLRTEDGLVVLDGNAEVGTSSTVRAGTSIAGETPAGGELGDVTIDTYAGDPLTVLGMPYDLVQVPADLGPLPAWRTAPPETESDDPWVVIVHGRGADKQQGNRVLATTYQLGLPNLSISLRNDPGAPPAPHGYGQYGATEWEDLQAAVDHLQAVEGAERFILVGYSQGGSVVLSFLRRSPDAELAERAVLVSPLVSLYETLELQAQERDIPDPLIPPLLTATRWISTFRSGLDFSQVEHLERIGEIPDDVELLVTHGDADRTVPVGPSRELAAALPRQVTYEEYAGVGHVREWNADRDRFDAELRAFLTEDPHVAANVP